MSRQEHRHLDSGRGTIDHRRTPRVEVLGRIQGELRALDVPVTLLNLSRHGFLMECPVDFTIGGSHDFRFTLPGESPVDVCVRVIHATKAADDNSTYVVGLEFEDQETSVAKEAIESLVRTLAGGHTTPR
jgi:hypothetical protein